MGKLQRLNSLQTWSLEAFQTVGKPVETWKLPACFVEVYRWCSPFSPQCQTPWIMLIIVLHRWVIWLQYQIKELTSFQVFFIRAQMAVMVDKPQPGSSLSPTRWQMGGRRVVNPRFLSVFPPHPKKNISYTFSPGGFYSGIWILLGRNGFGKQVCGCSATFSLFVLCFKWHLFTPTPPKQIQQTCF